MMGATFKPTRVALLFAGVLLCYVAVFYGIEKWRHFRGPWAVLFDADEKHQPLLVIEGEKTEATNLPHRVVFDRPRQTLPFGTRLHEDLVQLPGVETFDLFGHLIELAPRRLALNGREVPWASKQTIHLWPTNRLTRALVPSKSVQDTPPESGR